MLVNLAQLRAQRTSPSTFQSTTVEFEVDDPRRLKHLSLEQQKKRAKELLKAVQLHESDALEHWRSHGLNPDEAKLSNAQRVIARENGFRKWEELKAHADHIRIAQQATHAAHPLRYRHHAQAGRCRLRRRFPLVRRSVYFRAGTANRFAG